MKSIDKAIALILIGGVFPLLLSIISVMFWFYLDKNSENIWFYLIPGLVFGLLIDVKYLKGWIKRRYSLPLSFIIGIYFFHNICIYVMFMGVPVFNLFLGLIAGYYYSKKIQYLKIQANKQEKIKTDVCLFTALIMTCFCIASGMIAMADDTTGENLRLMFRLTFEVTKPMILTIIVVGGFALILLQYIMTRLTMNIMTRSFTRFN